MSRLDQVARKSRWSFLTAACKSIAELGGPYKCGSADTSGRTSIGWRIHAVPSALAIKAAARHLQSGRVA